MWTICKICGAVVADQALHATWHETLTIQPTTDTTEEPTNGH